MSGKLCVAKLLLHTNDPEQYVMVEFMNFAIKNWYYKSLPKDTLIELIQ